MELRPDTVQAVSRYVFDYIVGILWIAAGIAWAVSADSLDHLLTRIATLPKLPDFALGFLLAIAGVVLPYCVSVVLKPATLKLMNALQKVDRGLRKLFREQSEETNDSGSSLNQLARDRLVSELKTDRLDFREAGVTFLEARNPSVAVYISAIEREIFLRATAVPPSAILVGGLVDHFLAPSHLSLSVLVMIALLIFGSWSSNKDFESWMLTINTAILLTPETAPNAGVSQPPSIDPGNNNS
jgi:hypothetical protein